MAENNKLEVFEESDIQEGKIMAGLAHLGILFFLPLVACPNSRFGKFHANQSLLLLIAMFAVMVLSWIFAVIPVIGWILTLLCGLVNFALGIVSLVALIFGFTGKAFYIPVLDDIKLLNK